MPPEAHRGLDSERNRSTGLLVSLAVIGALALGGWFAGQWLSSAPARGPAAKKSAAAPDQSPLPSRRASPSSKPSIPVNPEIAGMRDQAMAVLKALEREYPHEPVVLSSIAGLYGLWALDDEAMQRWQRSIQLDPRAGSPYHVMGCSALVRGDYDEAVTMLRKALDLEPRLLQARLRLGEALTSAGQMEEAVKELERFVANTPGSAEGLFRLGQAYSHLGQHQKAKECQQRAIQIDPNCKSAYHALASACEALGQREEAAKHRQQFARLEGENPVVGANYRERVNDVDLARGNLTETHLVAARTYSNRGRVRDAETHLRAAATADPKNRESRLTLLQIYDRERRYREAADVLAELEGIEPKDPVHRINRGVLLMRLQELDAAEKEFRQAMTLAPEEPDGYARLARMYSLNNMRLPEARELAQTAIRLKPQNAPLYSLLADVCFRQGDREAAIKAIQRAIELDPANRGYQQAKTMLEEKRP